MSYIPRGCDQQGRYPEAAEAATEIGISEEPEHDMLRIVIDDVLICVAAIVAVCAVLMLAVGLPMFWRG